MEDQKLNDLRKGDSVAAGPGGELPAEPPWLDRNKIDHARKVYSKYFASINFSHLCGLLMSYYFSDGVEILLSTGHSSSTPWLLRRYLATIRHVQSWYEGDIWNTDDPSRKSLTSVRAMHFRAATKMAERKDGVTYFSQWAMTITQWGFIGPILLFPSNVGIHGCSEEDLDALVHFWRSIGYILGIEDKFNVCSGSLSEVTETCRTVMMKEYRVKLFEAHPSSVALGKDVMKALVKIENLLTWESMSTYIHEMLNVPCFIKMGLFEWFSYWLTYLTMVYLTRVAVFRALLNFHFRLRMDRADKENVLKKEEQIKLIPPVPSG